jgi:SAM-dependent methyltransferase
MSERSLADEWEAQATAWERWTRTPGHDHHFHRYNWPSFLKLLPPAGQATLDLGCGEGRAGNALQQLGHRLTGADSAPSLARLATRTGAYEKVVVADAAVLPFPDRSFDLVMAFMSLQDMDDAPAAVHQTARVLTPGGRFAAALVHPFASAHLGRGPQAQRSYFDVQRTIDDVERNGITFTFHQVHRPLHAWLALFFDAGLVIEDVREPRPSADDVEADPALAKTRAKPAFLHVLAAKRP